MSSKKTADIDNPIQKTQRGGNGRVIPKYQEPRNTGDIPNEQKEIFRERMNEKPKSAPYQPTINFQYYQPPPPRREPKQDIAPYLPMFAQQIGMPPQFGTHLPYQQQFQMPPIIQNIQISTDGPTADHQRLYIINEDVLPTKQFIASSDTLGERIIMHQFIRSSIFNNRDGEDIRLDGKGTNSLLSFIKFAELNPYNTYKFSLNPYKGLPDGFLIYRSCYPIRFENGSNFAVCAKNSTSVNVRIYKMLDGSYLMSRNNKQMFADYDEWREVAFYEYVREYILKKKLCPNFSNMYGFFISEKAGIDFDQINKMRNPNTPNTPIMPTTAVYKPPASRSVVQPDPNAYTGKTLSILTESPTYNLLGWASKTYVSRGNVKEMVNRGIHSEKEWYNILFQIMVGLYVAQLHKIIINDFSVEYNVYIKDLVTSGTVTNYWKYKIDDIEFYIPNLGYLVMIDSNFKNLSEINSSLTFGTVSTPNVHKLDGKFLGGHCKLTDVEMNDRIFEMFRRVFDSNAYGNEFANAGGCQPPAEIMTLFGNIYNESFTDPDKNIKKYIMKYMRQFLHNRVGTYLKENEIINIRRDDVREFKTGQMVVYEDGYGSYKFVIFMNTLDGVSTILTKGIQSDVDIIEEKIPISSLMNYSKAEPIMQTFRPNETNMNEDDLLETYIIR